MSYSVLVILIFLSIYSVVSNAILNAPVSTALSAGGFTGLAVSALLHRIGHHNSARILMLLNSNLLLFVSCYFEDPVGNASLIMLAFVGLPFIVFSWRENPIIVMALSILPLILWNILIFTNFGNGAYVEIDVEISKSFSYWHSFLVFFFIALEFWYFDFVTHSYSTALRQSLSAEKKSGRAKTAFLSSMNHELQTPLNAIVGGAELLRKHPQASADILRLADYVGHAGQDILSLMEKSMSYTRVTSGPVNATLRPEDPMELITSILDQINPLIQSKNIDVEITRTCSDLVLTDVRMLSEALTHLIDNAAKYSPEKGKIRIVVTQGLDHMLRISIKDNGSGIPKNKRQQVFLPFERLEQSLGTESGSGVGLTIAKAYITAMSGDIGISSCTDGGTHVWVELPLADR
ncbi:Sensory/regulatory protein RpfC [Thalassovita gelatinovora]|uniref:histidine kinase n=1 Tax=Thalassovita gelatinovora TaxID=53501 RepID=A0A0N7LVU5_THAGE|nr:HAMP domain-containing sensor histidine kinase [Thalassovita gelatinovora]QIZ81912.1 HAMP domain-containing histidine kinase [Thalassovita gelatinovora]CUH67274.1 Sensory/regulatory protein RpfC [Thalassovita gelatinovora]SEP77213.1 His Kinase A (phospho-acceptor) domain-containing protein [Thalassovita gelatinovora]